MSRLVPPSSGRVRVPRPLVSPSPALGPEPRWWGEGPVSALPPPWFGWWRTCFAGQRDGWILHVAVALLLSSVCSRVCTGSCVQATDVRCEAAAGLGRGAVALVAVLPAGDRRV